jgi:hypothetical protein
VNAKQHLDSQVILPLEQLYQRIRFNEQIVRDVYEGQVAMLAGTGRGTGGGAVEEKETSGHETETGAVSGIENKIKLIERNQKKLKEKIEAVGKKLIQQKNLSASALATSQATRTKISSAERSYYLQLQSWEELCGRLEQVMRTLTSTKAYLEAEKYLSPASGVGSAIQLTGQEEDVCENLLGSQVSLPSSSVCLSVSSSLTPLLQGEALKITNAATMELEDRLSSLM